MNSKVAVITGGTGGIGTEIVKEFVRNGYFVIVSHRGKSEQWLSEWLSKNQISENVIRFVSCNLCDSKHTRAVFLQVLQEFKVDVLVNNAGITSDASFLKMTEQSWREVIETNLLSLFHVTQLIAKQMAEHKSGSIVNISSINALKGQFGQTNYAASKAGIIGFTKSLAQELARKNICVNAIAPGYTLTPMVSEISENIKTKIQESIPTGRFVKPSEVAKAALFLSSDINSMTGETLSINGGQYMH